MADSAYGRVAKTLHWLVFGLFFAAFPLGIYMHNLKASPEKFELYALHKSIGVTILTLVALRLAWRLFNRPPPLPADTPPLERFAAHGVHWGMYAMLFAIPLAGWAMSSASGFPVQWWGVVTLPDIVGQSRENFELFKELHEIFAFVMLGLILVHVGAALNHHFRRKNSILARMVPFMSIRES